MSEKHGKFGIIVSGGPAPGINTVTASVVFTACDAGYEVVGFQHGMRGLIEQGVETAIELTPKSVAKIQADGGSILRTSRFNPFSNKENQKKLIDTVKAAGIDKLVLIGGEGTAFLSNQINKLNCGISVVHVPKTIDNDLILPNEYPSFGFETARHVGSELMRTLMTEARTTNRWFVVKTMGRNAGFLALGLGVSCGASVTVIPEQFDQKITLEDIVDVIYPSIIKRNNMGFFHGTVVLAEGLIDILDEDRVVQIEDAPRDEIGRLNFSEVRLEDLVVKALKNRIKKENLSNIFKGENIGYVLRCADPIPFDVEYTKFLGYGAVKFLMAGKSGIMVVRNDDKLDYVELDTMADENGRIRSRQVDINSDFYRVASNFMIK